MTAKTPTPQWLRQHLIDTGAWSADGINRRAQLRTHPCGQPVLTGLDADLCAWTATVDPTPLTTTGEMLALLGNRPTYDYRTTIRHLDGPRRPTAINLHPAGTRPSVHVLPLHLCGAPALPHLQPPAPPTKETNDAPPF